MSKGKLALTLTLLFGIASSGLLAHGVASTTLTTQEMEGKQGKYWWGESCTCGYDSYCGECIKWDALDNPDGETGSDYCTSSNDMLLFMVAAAEESCDCASWNVDCGDYMECTGQYCSDGCTYFSACNGCDAYVEGCDECQ